MFVPVTTITLAELSHEELAQGTGLYNFFRQLGGSFGIAVIATLVADYTTRYRAMLGDHLASGDPSVAARVQAMTSGLVARGADPWTAHQRALQLLDYQITGQASVIAYSRVYVISAALVLSLIPLLLLVRKSRGEGEHVIME